MSERIDHAAEAERLLTRSGEGHGDAGWGGLEDSIRGYGLATLALVEQQRIANLIAMSESGRTTVKGARAALSALYVGAVEDGTAHMQLRPDIAVALGIGDDGE